MLFWQRIKSDNLAIICISIILAVLLSGVFAPFIAPHDPLKPDLKAKFARISREYPLGTDHLGRCTLSRLLYGIRTTVLLSLLTMAATLFVGTLFGVIAGFGGGRVDETVMRLCDILLSFPSEVMILAIVGMLGPGLANVVFASIAAKWAWYARMIRSTVIQHKSKNHIYFAKVSGCNSLYIIQKHLLPAIASDISVLATLDTGWVILSISGLSFLSLGVQAPTPEWGMMLNEAKNIMTTHPGQMLAPGLAILTIVASFNFLGDSIQDALEPKRHCRESREKR